MKIKSIYNSLNRFIAILTSVMILWISDAASQTVSEENTNTKVNNSDVTKVYISAEGNVQGLLTQSSEETTTNSGAIGVFIVKEDTSCACDRSKSEFSAKIMIASSADTIKKDFGGSMLNPATGFQLAELDGRIWLWKNEPWYHLKGWAKFHFYGIISSGRWEVDNLNKNVTTMGWGVHLFRDLINCDLANNKIMVRFEFGLASRRIAGDITGIENKEFREKAIHTEERSFYGVEAGLTILINGVKAHFTYVDFRPYLFGPHINIPGLTDGQVLAAFTIEANIVKVLSSNQK